MFVDGVMFNQKASELDALLQRMPPEKWPDSFDGEFSLGTVIDGKFYLMRDPFGTHPLYFSMEAGRFAFERRTLVRMGFDAHSLPPGTVFQLSPGTLRTASHNFLGEMVLKTKKRCTDAELKDALINSVRKRLENARKPAVAFSGGVDSSLLAILAKRFANITLLSIGTLGSKDLAFVDKFAKDQRIEVQTKILSTADIGRMRETATHLLNENGLKSNPINIELAVGARALAEFAKGNGCDVVLMGSGAEECFGGYHSHVELHHQKGDLHKQLIAELGQLYSKDLDRNNAVTRDLGVQFRFPYLDRNVVKCALSIPPEEKIDAAGNRKVILRKIAQELGVPQEFAERQKLAMQYGSGISEALKKLV